LPEGIRRLVLVTRPPPGAAETARRLEALGHAALIAPVLRIEHLAPRLPAPDAVQAVLATSANALPALAGHRGCRLLAVGDATAARAREAGFTDILSAGRDAVALAALVGVHCDPAGQPLLLAVGAGEGGRLVGLLRADGFGVLRREAYAARPVERLPAAAVSALAAGEIGAALFFSSATVRAFIDLLGGALPLTVATGIDALALSPVVARALTPLPWRRIRVASDPNQDAILALMA
jgi:uroporphyrinogen-III synthase